MTVWLWATDPLVARVRRTPPDAFWPALAATAGGDRRRPWDALPPAHQLVALREAVWLAGVWARLAAEERPA